MNAGTSKTRDRSFYIRVLVKALLLFAVVNLIVIFVDPTPLIGKLTVYNWLVPGRLRLPFSDRPELAYSLTLSNLDAMFASHELSGRPKSSDEYRVLFLGDSATWGYLLKPEEAMVGAINARSLRTPDGRKVRAYNLAYPVGSAPKDLLLLQHTMRYQPDLIVWLVTLDTLNDDARYHHQLTKDNPRQMRELIDKYQLRMDPRAFPEPGRLERTLFGRRRAIADVLRLQIYGILWAATEIDHDFPSYIPVARDLKADVSFYDQQPHTLTEEDLTFDIIDAAVSMAGDVPLLIVNEPILVSDGKNSDIRYNTEYPRWVYDQYRELMARELEEEGWNYLDVWNLIPPDQFTDTEFHMTVGANRVLADKIGDEIIKRWKTSQIHSQPISRRKS